MIRFILVIILAIVSISGIIYAMYLAFTNDTSVDGFISLFISAICIFLWKCLIDTDDEVNTLK